MRWGGDFKQAQYGFHRAYEVNRNEAGYLFAEIFLFCERQVSIPEDLVDKAIVSLNTPPTTATTVNHFRFLSEACNHEDYDQGLAPLYESASRSENRNITSLGYYMLALTAYRRGGCKAEAG